MTKNLDLLTDEPLELAVALRKLAEKRVGEGDGDDEEWAAFSRRRWSGWLRICRG